MKYRLIGRGDSTTTGGVVLQGVKTMKTNHKPATLRGMSASCPACKQGIGRIQACYNTILISNMVKQL